MKRKTNDMEWISLNDQKPPKNETIFICGLAKEGKKIELYYAEAMYDGKVFDYPYYGQELTSIFKNVMYWIKPQAPK